MADSKTRYVDGFVLVVPKDKVEEYKKIASEGSKTWLKYGALSYKECMLEDAQPSKDVKFTFPIMVKAKEDETVWFSYIEYKSKAHRDEVNEKVMKDPLMNDPEMMEKMPFDMNRMAVGGFEVMVSD